MAKFQPKYPAEVRAAVEKLMVDGGSAGEAVKLAAAGELVEDLPPMKLNANTVSEWGRMARRRREDEERAALGLGSSKLSRLDTDGVTEVIRGNVLDQLEDMLRSVKRMGLRDPKRAALLREIVRTAAELRKLESAPRGGGKGAPDQGADQPETSEPELTDAQRLEQRARARAAEAPGSTLKGASASSSRTTPNPPRQRRREEDAGSGQGRGDERHVGEGSGGADLALQSVSEPSSPAPPGPVRGRSGNGVPASILSRSALLRGREEQGGSTPRTARP